MNARRSHRALKPLAALVRWLPVLAAVGGVSPQARSEPAGRPRVGMEPMVVHARKLPGVLGRIFGYSWNVSECTGGSNFHIRQGELVDAIGFRHLYLQEHPGEKAIVVVVMTPVDHRVTQAIVAYTDRSTLRVRSAELGDIRVRSLTAADIGRPDLIRKYIETIRDNNLMTAAFAIPVKGGVQAALDTTVSDFGGGGNESAALGLDPPPGTQGSGRSGNGIAIVNGMVPPTQASLLAAAEESGDYSRLVTPFGDPLYPGSPKDMLTSAYYWLNDTAKVGLIPVSLGPVTVDLSHLAGRVGVDGRDATHNAVVFDWDGVHYLYSDAYGTLGLPLPRDPVTGLPYLVMRHGDLLECLYFVATYSRQHPGEPAALVPPLDGVHAAAVFARNGKLWMLSPFLGRFALPARFRMGQIAVLARLHQALVARELRRLPPGISHRPATGLPEAMPGDSATEQVRRAYLAFRALGLPVTFLADADGNPGLEVGYGGTQYRYYAPGGASGSGLGG